MKKMLFSAALGLALLTGMQALGDAAHEANARRFNWKKSRIKKGKHGRAVDAAKREHNKAFVDQHGRHFGSCPGLMERIEKGGVPAIYPEGKSAGLNGRK